jgi:hypothetical protein
MDCVEVFIKKEYSEEEVYTEVYAALIDKKDAAQVLEQFCTDIPLQNYGLNHLKRIQPLNRGDKQSQLQIIVCPVQRFDEVPEHIRNKCTSKVTIKVCKLAPACRAEFEAWNQCWPINFHASHLEKEREKGLCAEDFAQVKMAEAALSAEESLLPYGGGVIVNPENGRIICSTSEAKSLLWKRFSVAEDTAVTSAMTPADTAALSPEGCALYDALYTPTMLCIHGVAAVLRSEMPDRCKPHRFSSFCLASLSFHLFVQRTAFRRTRTSAAASICTLRTSQT